ncbi:acetyl-CoA C-acyltransferase [Rhodobacter sp. SGA-6-6]|uniref:acetyl-CoA C-acyltransferase n=1 Tax=Rhodobacter sp. SGA-6-6 TaxID=2710882 RepID=UPI0013EB4205|nr:acetyl-CoA C-acyltransferase [Rhodobacter sp. SGA-6-6]NGM45342.1 acetyl-CoA C-acyltransferase [Rhodobacter sp. SGA-6-6]
MSARIIAARRTAVAPRGGAFRHLRIEDLAAPVVQAVLADAGLTPGEVDELVCSNALGAGGNPGRRVVLAAGLPERVAGLTLDRQCAGGLDAIALAAALVASGQARVVVAGGAESHSLRPLRAMPDPEGGPPVAYEQAPFTPWPDRDPEMAQAAAALAVSLGITRAEADAYAVESHRRALGADFRAEIVPLAGLQRDAFTRALTPALAARAKVLAGPVTAANAAVAADAAAFVVVAAEETARGRGLRIAASATLGADPEQPGLAPIPAIAAALAQAGIGPADLRQTEVMEAYAVQALACIRGAGLEPGIVNPKGGGLARGHPIGASGAILAVRLFHDLSAGHGLAAIASAGGIGAAMVLAAG